MAKAMHTSNFAFQGLAAHAPTNPTFLANGLGGSRPLPADDPVRRRPDITRARKLLQWEPGVQLDEGLKTTHTYFASLDLDRFRPPTSNQVV